MIRIKMFLLGLPLIISSFQNINKSDIIAITPDVNVTQSTTEESFDANIEMDNENVIKRQLILNENNNLVYLYYEPNEESLKVAQLKGNSVCYIITELSNWYKVISGDYVGFISKNDVKVNEENKALNRILFTNLKTKVYKEADVKNSTLGYLKYNKEYKILDETDNYYKINFKNQQGYVSKKKVNIINKWEMAEPYENIIEKIVEVKIPVYNYIVETDNEETEEDRLRSDIVNYALQFVGNTYVYGGIDLVNGIDCSGFTMRVYEHFDISLNRVSREQVNNGKEINIFNIKKGDLIFYGDVNDNYIEHVAIYIGNAKIVHASNSKDGIKISNMFYRQPLKVVSII